MRQLKHACSMRSRAAVFYNAGRDHPSKEPFMKASAKIAASAVLLAVGLTASAQVQTPPRMTFFVTSVGAGKGADFGGLAGADRHCQNLAWLGGAGHRTWRAYL